MIRIGDIVRFLNDVGGGRVVEVKNGRVTVEDEDGFRIPVPERECVIVESATVRDVEMKPSEKNFSGELQTKSGDILDLSLAYAPVDANRPDMSDFGVYLLNETNYSVYLQYVSYDADGMCRLEYAGTSSPYSREKIFTLNRNRLGEMRRKYTVKILPFKENKAFGIKPFYEIHPVVDPKIFIKKSSYKENEYLDIPAMIVPLVKEDRQIVADMAEFTREQLRELMDKGRSDRKDGRQAGKTEGDRRAAENDALVDRVSNGVLEVDLHADNILETSAGMSSSDILNYQLDFFRNVMNRYYRRKKGTRIVFIHGKGDGVLRQALLKTLKNEYPMCKSQDASFREYGYGATMVIL